MAYEFTGATDARRLQTASTPVTSWPLTMACWFNLDDTTNGQALINISNSGGFERFLLLARGNAAGDPIGAFYADSSNAFVLANTSTGFSASTWTHGAAVFTSSTSRTAYINGGSSGTNTASATLSNSGLNNITIGFQQFNNTGASAVDGRIAEVGIWNTDLSTAEIASLAKGMTCDKVRPQSLVAYFPLVRDLVELKGGLTITNTGINGTATVANHPRVYD